MNTMKVWRKKRDGYWDIMIGCFSDHFFSQKINAQGMVLEFMDHYYHGIMTGFFRQYLRRK